MATRREKVVLLLDDNFTGPMERMKRLAAYFGRRLSMPLIDRVQPGDEAPVLWQGDQA